MIESNVLRLANCTYSLLWPHRKRWSAMLTIFFFYSTCQPRVIKTDQKRKEKRTTIHMLCHTRSTCTYHNKNIFIKWRICHLILILYHNPLNIATKCTYLLQSCISVSMSTNLHGYTFKHVIRYDIRTANQMPL